MVRYFTTLYDATPCRAPSLPADINVTQREVTQAMQRIRPAKAMPTVCAASSLWKLVSGDVIPVLVEQFKRHLHAGASCLPKPWSCSELILLPKPGKPMNHPSQLRPINLLSVEAKILGAVVASRLQAYASAYLSSLPQFAYMKGRTLGQAVERVLSQCAQARQINLTRFMQSAEGLSTRLSAVVPFYRWTSLRLTIKSHGQTFGRLWRMPKSRLL